MTGSLAKPALLSAPPPGAPAAPVWLLGLLCAGLAGCGGGGGGSAPPPPPPPPPKGPLTVAVDPVVAGSPLTVRISLVAGAVGPADISVATAATGTSTGDATGSPACTTAGADFITTSATASVPAGASSVSVTIATCPNTSFEPNERLNITTSFEGLNTSHRVLLLNNAAGGLNDTGISQCLNAANALVACNTTDLPGQDATTGRDAAALTNDAADGRLGFALAAAGTGNACVQDQVTGLFWDGTSPAAATLAAAQAHAAAANTAARCGRSDWRLPTPAELVGIVDAGAASGARIDPKFGATPALPAWTATAYAGDARASWVVDFGSGAVAFESATNPLGKSFATRLVAGAAPDDADCTATTTLRYTDHGNGTVTDGRTGLMWQQCVDGLSGAACATGSATSQTSFSAALARATAVNADSAGAGRGFNDWRLPNRNELASLVNFRCAAPAIQRLRFPGTPALSTWTSSPALAGFVWYVDFNDGNVGLSGTSGVRVLRLVRAGQ